MLTWRRFIDTSKWLIVSATKELHTLDVEERRLMDSSCSSRPDLFSLNVTNTAMPLAKFSDGRHIPSVAERQLPLDE